MELLAGYSVGPADVLRTDPPEKVCSRTARGKKYIPRYVRETVRRESGVAGGGGNRTAREMDVLSGVFDRELTFSQGERILLQK